MSARKIASLEESDSIRRKPELWVESGFWIDLAVAHKTGKRIGLDTSTRLAMNTVFVPDREHPGDGKPQPFSRADGLKGALALRPFRLQFISLAPDRGPSIVTELKIQASDRSGAIVAAAEIAMPPRTIGLRILDSDGHEVFSRRRGDRTIPSLNASTSIATWVSKAAWVSLNATNVDSRRRSNVSNAHIAAIPL
jgi:hypothetical protein